MKKNKQDQNNEKKIILEISKKIVRNDGWSKNLITKLIESGVKKSDLVLYFKNNYIEILKFSLDELNLILENNVKKINIINFPTSKRIKKILLERLSIINKDKIFYKKTFNHLILPQNLKIMKKNLYKSVDKMWYIAGDNSTDFSFYSKRIILGAIYSNALIVLFNKNIKDVESNIDNNLNKIAKIPKLKDRFSFLKDNLPIFFRSFFS